MSKEQEVLKSAGEIVDYINKNKFVVVRFTKADGSIRHLYGTLEFALIPEKHKPKSNELGKAFKDIEKGILRIYDIEAEGWRSLHSEKIEWIEPWIGNIDHNRVGVDMSSSS